MLPDRRPSLLFGILSLAAASLGVTDASAAVTYLQNVSGNPGFTFEGNPVTHAVFDDTVVTTGSTSASTITPNVGNNGSMAIRTTSTGIVSWGLLAIKDMFTHVPTTSGGGSIQINSATLHLASNGSNQPSGYTINIRRVTTDWLANAAGTNEAKASGNQRNGTNATGAANVSGGVGWLSGSGSLAGQFGGLDYSTTNAVVGAPFANSTYGAYIGIDVTGIVSDMYALNSNYGFVISTSQTNGNNFVNIRASEGELVTSPPEPANATFRPVLEINYTYVPEPASLGLLALGALLIAARRGA